MMARSLLVAGALLAFFGGSVIAQDKTDKDAKAGKGEAKGKKVTWAVVKVGEDLKVVQEDKIADMQKDLDKEAKAHKKEKGKKGEKAQVIKKQKGGFATQEEAEKFREELASKEKKGGKGGEHKKDKD